MTTWTVVDEDDAKHFIVDLSAEGLRRAANDNQLLADIPKPMSVRLAIFIGASLGLMACVVLMFAEALIRNS
jgi:hypothetical protein